MDVLIKSETKTRIKERTIREVIEKVSAWRKYHKGVILGDGGTVKMSLDQAAAKV